jgi:hypothetical protein
MLEVRGEHVRVTNEGDGAIAGVRIMVEKDGKETAYVLPPLGPSESVLVPTTAQQAVEPQVVGT